MFYNEKTYHFSLLFCSIISFAQINFERGYIIENNGIKKEVLIKNIAWKNNPTEIEIKFTNDEDSKKVRISEISEFGVGNGYKFKRFMTKIDRSSKDVNSLSENKDVQLKEETLFLKYLVEGKINLYQYEDGNLVRFFYSPNTPESAEQLIYRQYINNQKVVTNSQYKQQLYNEMKSDDVSLKDFKNLNYSKDDLTALFVKYNQIKPDDFSNYEEKQNKGSFNLKVVLGVNNSSLEFRSLVNSSAVFDFGSQTALKFGIEAEAILPFNNNKWSIFLDPNYQHLKAEGKWYISKTEVDYKYLEIPFGARHYFFLNDKSRIFVNIGYSLSLSFDSTMRQGSTTNEIVKSSNYFGGLGFRYEKFGVEMRYNTVKKLTKYTTTVGEQKGFSLTASYTFL